MSSAAGSVFDRDGDGKLDQAEATAKVSAKIAFQKIDVDGSGSIDASELSNLLDDLGEKLAPDDLDKAMRDLDRDGSGQIELEEFVNWFFQLQNGDDGELHSEEEVAWRKALRRGAKKARQRMGTDIHRCAWEGNLEVVRVFLETNRDLVNAKDKNEHGDEFRPLHYAAYQGHYKLCKDLLSHGADIDAVTGSGCTALFFACQQGRKKVVKLLLKHRASASIVENECGLGPLDVADNDKIRALFLQCLGPDGKPRYGRPGRVEAPQAELVSSKRKSSMNSATPSKPSSSSNVQKKNTISIKVSWDPAPVPKGKDALPVSGYIVRVVNEDTGRDQKVVDIVASEDGGSQTARIGSLPEGVPMVVRIAAVNGLGRGKYSEPSNLVAAARRPGKMNAPAILDNATTPNSLSISWVDSVENLGEATKVEVQLRRVCDSEEYTQSHRTPTASATESQTNNNRVHLPGDEFCPYFQGKVTKKTVCKCVTSEAFTLGCSVDVSEGKHVAEVKGLVSGSVYEVRVCAVNVAGRGSVSASTMAETSMFSSGKISTNRTRQSLKANKSRTAQLARAPTAPKAKAPPSRSRTSRADQPTREPTVEPFTPEGKEQSFRGRRGRFKVNHVGEDEI